MSSKTIRIAAIAVATTAVAGTWASVAEASPAAPRAAAAPTISVYCSGPETTVNVLHKKAFGVGDEIILNQPCDNAANHRQKVGRGYVIFTFVSKTALLAQATLTLAGGDLTVAGVESFTSASSPWAVTGGTGAYDGASGYATVTAARGRNAAVVRIYLQS
jgi:hypothetical protein